MAFQRTRRPRFRSGRSLRSLGSPLNAYPLGVRLRYLALFLLVGVACVARGQESIVRSIDWEAADRQTTRLTPDRFPELPAAIRAYLREGGFTIPQSYLLGMVSETDRFGRPHNITKGHFRSSRATDWAVLASRDRVSRILVFWSGSVQNVAEIGEVPDARYLQHTGGKTAGFSRLIMTAEPKRILRYREIYGDEPIPVRHDGIEDYFEGKASSIHYSHNGEWLSLTGAD